ncbi:MAG: ABC transporter permease subunit, partial [Paracoccaceae bacterium]
QLRLPVFAVLAYAMTNVDMALVLGPTLPHTLAVEITLWTADPDLTHQSLAAAAALVQLAATIGAILLWTAAERLAADVRRAIAFNGLRLTSLDAPLTAIASLTTLLLAAALIGGLASLAVWSISGLWPFAHALPDSLTLAAWTNAAPALATTTGTTLLIAGIATTIALALTVTALQAEYVTKRPPIPIIWLYLPLIIPQICFLPGIETLLLDANASGGIISVAAAHLIFVVPYTWLSFAAAFRAWDTRIATVAATLGASQSRIFWRLRLPMLLAPLLTAAAISFAVSIGQYLPTLLVGGGRVTTLTTEALALASGGNRRLTATHALLQTLLPAITFGAAIALPTLLLARRKVRGFT